MLLKEGKRHWPDSLAACPMGILMTCSIMLGRMWVVNTARKAAQIAIAA
jgi:hypothetical protein